MNPWRICFLSCSAFLFTGLAGLFADATVSDIDISTPAFEQGTSIPIKYAGKGENMSPAINIGTVPVNAKSLVLIIDDLDAPDGVWTHWLVWNLPADTISIPEGKLPPNAVQGKNSYGHAHYDGPAPPSGTHRYFFHVFALDTVLRLSSEADRDALEAAMKGHIVGTGVTFGTYSVSQ